MTLVLKSGIKNRRGAEKEKERISLEILHPAKLMWLATKPCSN